MRLELDRPVSTDDNLRDTARHVLQPPGKVVVSLDALCAAHLAAEGAPLHGACVVAPDILRQLFKVAAAQVHTSLAFGGRRQAQATYLALELEHLVLGWQHAYTQGVAVPSDRSRYVVTDRLSVRVVLYEEAVAVELLHRADDAPAVGFGSRPAHEHAGSKRRLGSVLHSVHGGGGDLGGLAAFAGGGSRRARGKGTGKGRCGLLE